MTAAGVELRELEIGYRSGGRLTRRQSTTVASGLHATARRGELTVLLGPNGSGKSTLIRTLCGLQPALGGQVLLGGSDLVALAPDDLARRVAVVLTDRVDPGLLSARELAGLGRIPHLGLGGRLGPEDQRIVEWALGAVGAGHLADRPAAELSDGERQRVLTARALAQQPTLLVLDEPTAFLDVPSRAGLVALLRRLAREQDLAVLMSTHDLELALRVADRVWLMGEDRRLVDAAPEQLALSGQIGALFDGDNLRFDAASGVFVLQSGGARSVRIEAPEPLASALARMLSREGFETGDDAVELVLEADASGRLRACHDGRRRPVHGLRALPDFLRALPPSPLRAAGSAETAAALANVSEISAYFAIGTGTPRPPGGWAPVSALYLDDAALAALVERVRGRIRAEDRRVGVSTLFLGYCARLWSICLGAYLRHGIVVELDPARLLWQAADGPVRLHVDRPLAWLGGEDRLASSIIDHHIVPLIAAVRRLGPVSERMLWGNAASALLGAARMLDGGRQGAARDLALRILGDPRLAGAVEFDGDGGYRRKSCCLYYRTPTGGLCGDCVLPRKPSTPHTTDKEPA